MKITKTFTAELGHKIFSNIHTPCKNIHGHSYKIELTLEGSPVNQANMVLDFAGMKDCIKPFIESFDHCMLFCQYDNPDYINFIKNNCHRWISVPFNCSCEMMALMIFRFCQEILNYTEFSNGETPKVSSVTVWETATGRCTVDEEDIKKYYNDLWMIQTSFSDSIVKEWPKELKNIFIGEPKSYKTKKVPCEVKLPGVC